MGLSTGSLSLSDCLLVPLSFLLASVIVPPDAGADLPVIAGEIQAGAGVELAGVGAVELLPRRGVGERLGLRIARAAFPFLGGHEGIDAARAEIDADAVACAQPGEAAIGEGLGRGVEDRGAGGGAALAAIAERG